MKIFNKKVILVIILIIAAVLRFYRLGEYPALNADEASIGYDAYSLIQTGQDQHGNPWPISFQSFNDYKPGLIVYLVLPFIKVFGLSIFWLRFFPALLGVGTVWIVYLLTKELFRDLQLITYNLQLAIASAFMLAVSPWHIHFSRGAWEVNIATFFMTLGILMILKWIAGIERDSPNSLRLTKNKYLVLSIMSFVLSMYSYHSARLIVPLLGLGIVVVYRKVLFKDYKTLIFNSLFLVLLLVPLIINLFSVGLSRVSGVGLAADPGIAERTKEQQGEHFILGLGGRFIPRLIHNKYVNYGLTFGKNWTEHFGGNFLFIDGDGIQRNKIPEMGLMYYFEISTLLIGFIYILKSKILNPKSKSLLFYWFLVAPTAAALTFQSPHALRAQNMVIPLTIISAVGLAYIIEYINKIKNKKLLTTYYLLLTTFAIFHIANYLHQYYVHMARQLPYSSQYGLNELVDYIKTVPEDKKIVISDRYDQPYVLFLFYLRYPPQDFQNNHVLTTPDRFGFSTVREFDRYQFLTLDWEKDKLRFSSAFIAGAAEEIPDESNIIKEIYGSNGFKYFQVVAN